MIGLPIKSTVPEPAIGCGIVTFIPRLSIPARLLVVAAGLLFQGTLLRLWPLFEAALLWTRLLVETALLLLTALVIECRSIIVALIVVALLKLHVAN